MPCFGFPLIQKAPDYPPLKEEYGVFEQLCRKTYQAELPSNAAAVGVQCEIMLME